MIKLNRQITVQDKKKKAYYDICLIIDKSGNLVIVDNSESDYTDFVDSSTETVIPMIIKLK